MARDPSTALACSARPASETCPIARTPPRILVSIENAVRAGLDAAAATDPGLTRLRMASRVVVTLVLVAGALAASHAVAALPAPAYAVALTLALQGSVAIRDATHRRRIATRAISAAAGFLVLAGLSLVSALPLVVDAAFLAVAFLAVYARRWGTRWNAVGMLAFMSCFIGAYFRPAPADLGAIAFALVLSAIIADFVRDRLIPDRPAADVRRTLEAADRRIAATVSIIRRAGRGGWTPRSREAAVAAGRRVKAALAVAEGFLPADAGAGAGPQDVTATLAIRLFDLQLACETALATGLAAEPANPWPADRLRAAFDRLAAARLDARKAAAALTDESLDRPAAPPTPTGGRPTPPAHVFADPAFRLAAQVAIACAVAMAGGLLLSHERWFWAVLTAFLVFTNTQSRGDTALRGAGRAFGTAAGIVVGIGVATLLHGASGPSLVLVGTCVFLAFYLLQVSYGAMTFFMTVALSLVYGLLGEVSPGLLVLRLEETLIGAVAGVGVAFLVFPQRTDAAGGRAVDGFLAELDRLLGTAEAHRRGEAPGWKLMAVTRTLDRRHGEIATALRPLESGWLAPPRRRRTRRGLLRFTVLAYWAHQLAGALTNDGAGAADEPRLDTALAACRAELAALRRRSGDVFGESRAVSLLPPETLSRRHDPARPGAALAVHAIRHILRGVLDGGSGGRDGADPGGSASISTAADPSDKEPARFAERILRGRPEASLRVLRQP